jgi:hypothetical protein
MVTRKVVLSDLPQAEKERFFEFLVANKVEFMNDEGRSKWLATIRVVPPEPQNSRVTDRARKAQKQNIRKANSVGGMHSRPKSSQGGQGNTVDPATTLRAAQAVLRRRYGRFCNLLPQLTNPPKAVRKTALLRFADEVYDARYEKDAQFIKSEAAGEPTARIPQNFPEFIFEFCSKRYGLKTLISNNCWGMVSSVELLRGQNVGVDLFGKFIDETYDATDLLFFLFTRSAIDKVINVSNTAGAASAEDEDQETTADNKKGTPTKAVAQEIRMNLNQVVQVVKMAIDSKRQDLREQVIKKLDLAMAARTEGAARKAPTLEPERLLAIATEEYHNSRDLSGELTIGENLKDDFTNFNPDGSVQLPKEKDLSPEIRKEVRQVTARLLASLAASGETDANPQQVYEWALQVTLRRHKMSSEEFEKDLEQNVRRLLLDATQDVIGKAVGALSKDWQQDKEAKESMKSALVSEFAPTADILMEALVSKDFKKWLETLRLEGRGSQKMKEQFEKLHEDFNTILNSDITPSIVQTICQTVVGSDELQSLVKSRAKELSKIGKMKKLGDSSSEEEPDD